MWEIFVSVILAIVGIAYSRNETLAQMDRSQRETFIRGALDRIESQFALSVDQLNQLRDSLDIELANLKEATRGSARLSAASAKLREFISKYPEMKNQINDVKNYIVDQSNKLQAREDEFVKKVQAGGDVNDKELAAAGLSAVGNVNAEINKFNKGKKTSKRTSTIDTSLVPKPKEDPLMSKILGGDDKVAETREGIKEQGFFGYLSGKGNN